MSFDKTKTLFGHKAVFTGPGHRDPVCSQFNWPGRVQSLVLPPRPSRDALLKLMRNNICDQRDIPPAIADDLRANGAELAEGHGRIGLVSKVTHEGDWIKD
ncbi:hypothetical protein M2323_003930 [Rhodoblastus acidophilus]|uniref:hypothetical protein n=1 Tax=Rhodoblastus acidophilus TaxID=1074 RepID=UPI002224D402|nr:hypothetical protein [Rhodoblastus acidophilus]MCW2286093.1 hypothetical protein [Rhodoblastus acidophilus]MCW2334987.1 hypothetical protein [Rhodoblastus acidophilus]